jgi:hypothetical protein
MLTVPLLALLALSPLADAPVTARLDALDGSRLRLTVVQGDTWRAAVATTDAATAAGLHPGGWLALTLHGAQATAISPAQCPWAVARCKDLTRFSAALVCDILAARPEPRGWAWVELAAGADLATQAGMAPADGHGVDLSAEQLAKLPATLLADGFLECADAPLDPHWPPTLGTRPVCLLRLRNLGASATRTPHELRLWLPWSAATRSRLQALGQAVGPAAAEAVTRLLGSTADWPQAAEVAADTYDGYFVSNRFQPEAPASFVVARDQAAFDGVFHAGFVMGDTSHRLPDRAFDTRLVIAAVKRGAALWQYRLDGVTADAGVLTVRYTTHRQEVGGGATYACPLIVSAPKGDWHSVEFIEDGRLAATVGL